VKGQDLRDRGATDLRSALRSSPADIAPGGDGGPAAAVPECGASANSTRSCCWLTACRGGAFSPDTATLSLQDVERIEILRGAA
jgi:hypothetical protein